MKNAKRFVGFDLGAESGRCIVATLNDQKIILDEVHRFTTHNLQYDKGFHWDILAIAKEITDGLIKAQKEFGPVFDGISIDTWGVDYVLLDAEDRILGYPYHYRDNRTDEMMEEAFHVVSKELIYSKVGIQFAQFNTLFQLLAEKKRKSSLLNITGTMLLMPDYLNYFLSGIKRAEFSIASTTGLADPNVRNWSWELIDAFTLPRKIFPQMVEPATKLGTISPWLASKTGIDTSTPVIASAGHDTASAVASIPAEGGTWAFLSSGTWSLMGLELKKPLLGLDSMNCGFTNEGGVEKTTRFLKNIIGLWPIQECRRFWLEKGNDFTYPQLADLAKAEGFVGTWVDLKDNRFLKAGEMPDKIIAYLKETGQTVKSGEGFITEVVLESLAFSYRKTIKDIEKITRKKIEKLHAVGGGIKNELLTQMTADATGCEVFAGPVEGAIVGNIGMQAIATGAVSNLSAWREIVAKSFDFKSYTPANAAYFDENEYKFNSILK